MTSDKLFPAVCLSGLLVTAASACPVGLMQQASDVTTATEALQGILNASPSCSATQQDWASRLTAVHHVQEAQRLLAAHRPLDEVLLLLDTALRHGALWQALALRGDLRQQVRGAGRQADFAAASLDYQAALNAIDATDPIIDPVPVATIAELWRKAEQTRMLADGPFAVPLTRNGVPGGLALRRVRSFLPVSVAMPVQFVFDTHRLTEGGRRAAEDLWQMLDTEDRPDIRLVGHTDPDGGDDYNLALSRRRAMALRDFLVERGYDPARVDTDGRGEREPLQLQSPYDYTHEQVFQIMRRVELVRR